MRCGPFKTSITRYSCYSIHKNSQKALCLTQKDHNLRSGTQDFKRLRKAIMRFGRS